MIEMSFIIPIDETILQIGPIENSPCRQPVCAVGSLDQLHESFCSVDQAGSSIRGDGYGLRREIKPVGLFGQLLFVSIRRRTDFLRNRDRSQCESLSELQLILMPSRGEFRIARLDHREGSQPRLRRVRRCHAELGAIRRQTRNHQR